MKINWGADGVARGNFAGINVWGVAGIEEGVILPVKDSKKTNKKQREKIIQEISCKCFLFVGCSSVEEIERFGIDGAEQKSLTRALHLACNINKHAINVLYGDMLMPFIPNLKMERIISADAHIPCVSAASIIAKYALDLYWARLHEHYPHYDFINNAAYGMSAKKKIATHGLLEGIHRRNYAPCRELITTSVNK